MEEILKSLKDELFKITKNQDVYSIEDTDNFIQVLNLSSMHIILFITKIEKIFNISFGDNIEELNALSSLESLGFIISNKKVHEK